MGKNVSQSQSCNSLDPPTAEQILAEIDPATSTLYAVLTAMVLIGILVYVEEIIYLLRKTPPSYKRTTYIWITGAPTVIAATSCTGLWIPRSSMFTDFTAAIYFTICIHKFLVMMIEEYGGDSDFLHKLKDTPIKISTGPCCCCCLCLPTVKMSRQTLNILKFGTLQSAFLRPVLMFFAIVLWSNGNYEQGKMHVHGAFFWITIFTVITFIVSLWPLGILFYQAKSNLANQKIVPKFVLNQCVLILSQAQAGILSILVGTGSIACAPPFSPRARGVFMNHQLLIMEMFVILLLSRCYYRRKYDELGLDTLQSVSPDGKNIVSQPNGKEMNGRVQWV